MVSRLLKSSPEAISPMLIDSHRATHASLDTSLATKSATARTTSQPFEQQFASALRNVTAKSQIESQIEKSAPTTAPVVLSNPDVPAATTTSTTTSTSNATTATTPAASTSEMTPTEAYWAEQPPAVQALQYAPDDQKAAMAQQLANEGYTIDVPIMVWGWDPLATMIQRQEDGYTWVPSALQPSSDIAPGVSMPGEASYNASNPPAGSIQVSTAFADGTDIAADPIAEMWLQGETGTSATSTLTNS